MSINENYWKIIQIISRFRSNARVVLLNNLKLKYKAAEAIVLE